MTHHTWSHVSRVMQLYRSEPLMVSHYPGKFGGHSCCGSGDMNVPTNIVILQQIRDAAFVRYLWLYMSADLHGFHFFYGMSCAMSVANNNLRNIFLCKLFLMCLLKKVPSSSLNSSITISDMLVKNTFVSLSKNSGKKEKEKKKKRNWKRTRRFRFQCPPWSHQPTRFIGPEIHFFEVVR